MPRLLKRCMAGLPVLLTMAGIVLTAGAGLHALECRAHAARGVQVEAQLLRMEMRQRNANYNSRAWHADLRIPRADGPPFDTTIFIGPELAARLQGPPPATGLQVWYVPEDIARPLTEPPDPRGTWVLAGYAAVAWIAAAALLLRRRSRAAAPARSA